MDAALPIEILCLIFTYLDWPAKMNMRLTSKYFGAIFYLSTSHYLNLEYFTHSGPSVFKSIFNNYMTKKLLDQNVPINVFSVTDLLRTYQSKDYEQKIDFIKNLISVGSNNIFLYDIKKSIDLRYLQMKHACIMEPINHDVFLPNIKTINLANDVPPLEDNDTILDLSKIKSEFSGKLIIKKYSYLCIDNMIIRPTKLEVSDWLTNNLSTVVTNNKSRFDSVTSLEYSTSFNGSSNMDKFINFLRYFPNLSKLKILMMLPACISIKFPFMPQLKKLDVCCTGAINVRDILKLPNLKVLRLRSVNVKGDISALRTLKNLIEVKLIYVYDRFPITLIKYGLWIWFARKSDLCMDVDEIEDYYKKLSKELSEYGFNLIKKGVVHIVIDK